MRPRRRQEEGGMDLTTGCRCGSTGTGMVYVRPGANVFGTRVLEYIFEVLVLILMEIMDHVLVLIL